MLHALHSRSIPVNDRNLVKLLNAGLAHSSEAIRHAKEVVQAGAAQVIARVVVQQQQDPLLLRQAVALAEVMCIATTDAGAAAMDEADAQALLPMVQPLVGLMDKQGVQAELHGLAAVVLATMATGSELMWTAVAAAGHKVAVDLAAQQQQRGVAGAGGSTAAAGGGDGLVDVVAGASACDQDQAQLQKACGACGADSKPNGKALMQCSACLGEWYCSATCQRKHWKVHKRRCPGYKGG